MRRAVLALAILALLAGFGLGVATVSELEGSERDVPGEWQRLADLEAIAHHQLVVADLREGQSVLFEVCSEDGFGAPWRGATAFDIWALGGRSAPDERVSRLPMDDTLAARVQREPGGAGCLVVAQSDGLRVSGDYALAIAWDEAPPAPLADVAVRGRILAWTPIPPLGRAAVWILLASVLLLVAGASLPRRASAFDEEARALQGELARDRAASAKTAGLSPGVRLGAGLSVLVLAMVGLSFVPLGGSTVGVVRGLLIAAIEIAAAAFFVQAIARSGSEDAGDARPERAAGLGLSRPRPGWWLLALAPLVGGLLWFAGLYVMRLVPSTGEAPIEAFVRAPSGALAMACVAVVVPLAEELFFRGFVYGTAERWKGANAATVASIVLFAVVHLPQQWGAWGAFASVTLTGVVLTLLRRATGSTLVPALAHVAHNALTTLLALGL